MSVGQFSANIAIWQEPSRAGVVVGNLFYTDLPHQSHKLAYMYAIELHYSRLIAMAKREEGITRAESAKNLVVILISFLILTFALRPLYRHVVKTL